MAFGNAHGGTVAPVGGTMDAWEWGRESRVAEIRGRWVSQSWLWCALYIVCSM